MANPARNPDAGVHRYIIPKSRVYLQILSPKEEMPLGLPFPQPIHRTNPQSYPS